VTHLDDATERATAEARRIRSAVALAEAVLAWTDALPGPRSWKAVSEAINAYRGAR